MAHRSLVDGRRANLTPILLYKERLRIVRGFELTRNSLELDNDRFEMTGTYAPFIARRTQPSSHASATGNAVGTIRFEFLQTRYTKRQPGRMQQLTANNSAQTPHQARSGVMATAMGRPEVVFRFEI